MNPCRPAEYVARFSPREPPCFPTRQPEIELTVSTEQVCFIITKARQFQVKDVPAISDPASNASDDRMVSVLEARTKDPVAQEIRSFVNAMDEDQQIDLVALTWVGRGDSIS